MSEMEDLKKEADISKIRQQYEAVNAYVDGLAKLSYERLESSIRADSWFFISVASYMVLVILMVILETPPLHAEIARQLMQMIEFLMLARSWWYTREWSNTYSEFKGALHILVLLGMIPPGDAQRRKLKRPLWERGIELVEKWARQAKKKDVLVPA